MNIKILDTPTKEDWKRAYDTALMTMNKKSDKDPSSQWKHKIILSEHSPIYDLHVTWEWGDIPYWVSVHFVRHRVGINHFVTSQRNDRQDKYDRDTAPQGALVSHRCTANFMEILAISKRRLCGKASKETRAAWNLFLDALAKHEPELVDLCVPNCVYRNKCTEFEPCGRVY